MEIQIRKAEISDAVALEELLRALGIFASLNQAMPEVAQARIRKHLGLCLADESHLILVAETADCALVGYCAVHWLPYLFLTGPEGYVSELFVQDEFRGLGIGGQLLEKIQAEAVARDCSRLLLLNMRDRESYQRHFYSKHGWVERPDAANFVLDLRS